MAVEEPAFQSILQVGDFEIRDYPALVVAEVSVTGEASEAANQGFRILAGYIFGGNTRKQQVAMTAPVSRQPAGEQIPMTAPVAETRAADAWIIRFNMPAGSTLETLPEPNDSRVHLRVEPPTRFAVIRFSGYARQGPVEEKTAELKAWMVRRKLAEAGPPTLAQYNPPWTLWFLRRNEVMIPVAR